MHKLTISLEYDPATAWFVQVNELPGCMSQGDTVAEALEMIQEAMDLWIEVANEDAEGIEVPLLK